MRRKNCVIFLLVVMVFLFRNYYADASNLDACLAVRGFVEKFLKAPSSAKFPSCSGMNISSLGGGKYLVKGYVDSQNSFGAVLRSEFSAKIQDTGKDNWILLRFFLDGKDYGGHEVVDTSGMIIEKGAKFYKAQKPKKYNKVEIEVGEGTDAGVEKLLKVVANNQKTYFKKIYGQYRNGTVILIMTRNSEEFNIDNLDSIGREIVKNILKFYPRSNGRVEFEASQKDVWDFFKIYFTKDKIDKTDLMPSMEGIKVKLARIAEIPETRFGLTEEQRKKFAEEINALIEWAQREGEKKYGYTNDVRKMMDYEDKVYYPKEEQLLKKYGLSEEESKKIFAEGYDRKWID